MPINPEPLDPEQVAAVATLRAAVGRGYLDLPGIGRAAITSYEAHVKERYPPLRTTTLTLVITHAA